MSALNALIRLTPCQAIPFAQRKKKRFRIVVAGRRWGKTHWEIAELVAAAIERERKGEYWYVAPSYKQGKRIAWPVLKQMLPREIVKGKINETELKVDLTNGAVIRIVGADDPDSLRGSALAFVTVDEYATMKWLTWDQILRPALADNQGGAIFAGTPAGYNHYYDLFMQAQLEPDWEAWTFTTLDGGNVPAEEVEHARRTMDPRIFAQEFEASFENLAGRVYTGFSHQLTVRGDLTDLGGELLVGMDFNVDPMVSIIGQRCVDEIHILQELVLQDSNTREMSQALLQVAEKDFGAKDGTRREVITYPDPTGRKRQTNAAVGVTDFNIIRDHGLKLISPSKAYPINDRVNTVNGMFLAADGQRRLFIHPSCRYLIKGCAGQTWKEGVKLPDKSLGLDHPVDAMGYLVCGAVGLLGAGPAGAARMIM